VEVLVLDVELPAPVESGAPPGTTVVFSVDVFVLVFVDGPGTTVVVWLPGRTVVVCVLVAGGFSTVVSQPANPITASAQIAAMPIPRFLMVCSLVFVMRVRYRRTSGGRLRVLHYSLPGEETRDDTRRFPKHRHRRRQRRELPAAPWTRNLQI
jgi:hypothetical protein